MMEPLLKRHQFHHSEFRMLAIAQMELYLAENTMDGVRSWYQMRETFDPDDPALDK